MKSRCRVGGAPGKLDARLEKIARNFFPFFRILLVGFHKLCACVRMGVCVRWFELEEMKRRKSERAREKEPAVSNTKGSSECRRHHRLLCVRVNSEMKGKKNIK